MLVNKSSSRPTGGMLPPALGSEGFVGELCEGKSMPQPGISWLSSHKKLESCLWLKVPDLQGGGLLIQHHLPAPLHPPPPPVPAVALQNWDFAWKMGGF